MPAGEIDLFLRSFVGFLRIYDGANGHVPYVGFWDCVPIESIFFGFFRLLTRGTITFFTAC